MHHIHSSEAFEPLTSPAHGSIRMYPARRRGRRSLKPALMALGVGMAAGIVAIGAYVSAAAP